MLQYQLPKTNVTIKGRKGNRKNYLEKETFGEVDRPSLSTKKQ